MAIAGTTFLNSHISFIRFFRLYVFNGISAKLYLDEFGEDTKLREEKQSYIIHDKLYCINVLFTVSSATRFLNMKYEICENRRKNIFKRVHFLPRLSKVNINRSAVRRFIDISSSVLFIIPTISPFRGKRTIKIVKIGKTIFSYSRKLSLRFQSRH